MSRFNSNDCLCYFSNVFLFFTSFFLWLDFLPRRRIYFLSYFLSWSWILFTLYFDDEFNSCFISCLVVGFTSCPISCLDWYCIALLVLYRGRIDCLVRSRLQVYSDALPESSNSLNKFTFKVGNVWLNPDMEFYKLLEIQGASRPSF